MDSLSTLIASAQRSSKIFSLRGQNAIEFGAKNLMWEVLNNLWHPDTNPNGYISVGIAENVMMHDVLLEYLNAKLELPSKWLTYNEGSMGSTYLRTAVSHFLNRHLKPHRAVVPSHIVMTNGVSSAVEHLSCVFTDPGEGILLGRPYYGTFIADLALRTEAVVVPVEFGEVDPVGDECVAKYEQALTRFEGPTGKRVRALMLCHPHNPLGRCYPLSAIIELMKFCQAHQIHFISDEIYALSVWENTVDKASSIVPFHSALSIDTTNIIDPDLVHVLWGVSKDFGANGLRIGAIISQSNPTLHTALNVTSVYSYTSALSDWLVGKLLRDDAFTDNYICRNQEMLSKSYAYIVEQLRKFHIEYMPGCNAGFFIWVNLGKKYLEKHPGTKADGDYFTDMIMQKLLDKRVFLASGTAFGSEHPGWFRIIFAFPISYLDEAMRRIVDALEPENTSTT